MNESKHGGTSPQCDKNVSQSRVYVAWVRDRKCMCYSVCHVGARHIGQFRMFD